MNATASQQTIRFRSDLDKPPLKNLAQYNKWAVVEDDSWHIFWASVQTVRRMFLSSSSADGVSTLDKKSRSDSGGNGASHTAAAQPLSLFRLQDCQILNHFPNHWELTRKDLMFCAIRRYHKDLLANRALLASSAPRGAFGSSHGSRHSSMSSASSLAKHFFQQYVSREGDRDGDAEIGFLPLSASIDPGETVMSFVPSTFSLPRELPLFIEETKRCGNNALWIVKPSNRSQGRGIFLVSKASQVVHWLEERAVQEDHDPVHHQSLHRPASPH